MLAARAFSGIAAGLESAARAIIAWKQIGPLFQAAYQPPSSLPFLASAQAGRRNPDQPLIEADGLTYSYGEREPVLRDATFTIHSGEKILLDGPSGGGKSTIASILAGLRDPAGLLLLNGLDRATLGDSWHAAVTEAPQFQENHILSGTLAFNLLMGRNWPASESDLEEARRLCVELGLGPLLEKMPSGLMQTVGETGWQLSHGERSRIFLARALLQKAQLTILDESFGALDPETLKTCLESALKRTQSLMVIAHP